MPTWNGPAWRMRIATVGTASTVTWLPNTLTLSPAHSLRKSGWRHRRPPNTGRFYRERTLEETAVQDNSNSVRNLVIGMLLVATPFAIAYLLTRGNPGSEVLLIVDRKSTRLNSSHI